MGNPTRLTFHRMMEEVVHRGTCSGCGSCVVVCPYDVLHYEQGKPLQRVLASLSSVCPVANCIDCDICAQVCPRLEPSIADLDREVHGRPRTLQEASAFGVFQQVLLARTTEPRIAAAAQDGGVVTTVLWQALKQGMIDGAVTCGADPARRWGALPRVATTFEELLESARSRYTYSPNPLAMLDAVSSNLGKLALVGTPCEISPAAKARMAGIEEFAGRIAFTIGLLCTESFTYEGLIQRKIQGELGVSLDDVTKINIKGKVIVYLRSGTVHEIPLKDAKEHQRPECSFCGDFSAEHADLSVGGLGMDGWTLVVVRNDRGRAVLDAAISDGLLQTRPIEEFPETRDLLVKMSERQRRRAARAAVAAPRK